ncbi:515db884-cb3a-49d9-9cde-06cfafec9eaa, partial [Sclerotinia trifoliorum]
GQHWTRYKMHCLYWFELHVREWNKPRELGSYFELRSKVIRLVSSLGGIRRMFCGVIAVFSVFSVSTSQNKTHVSKGIGLPETLSWIGSAISSVKFIRRGAMRQIDATDMLIVAGPWPSKSRLVPIWCFSKLQEEIRGKTEVDQKLIVLKAIINHFPAIKNGEFVLGQACFRPQIRKHGEGEAVSLVAGGVPCVTGLWIAAVYDWDVGWYFILRYHLPTAKEKGEWQRAV